MNKEVRIVSHISPELEESLLNYNISTDIINLFQEATVLFSKLRHLTLLIIPKELTSVFKSNPHLRIIISAIESDPQSNILFYSSPIPTECNLKNNDFIINDFPNSICTRNFIVNSLSNGKIPILVCHNSLLIKKEKCINTCGSLSCADEVSLFTSTLPDIEDFNSSLKDIIKSNIDLWSIGRTNVKVLDLKLLSFLLCVFYNIDKDMVVLSTNYYIHNSLCNDIKDVSSEDFINITFSMSRSILFNSVTDTTQERSIYSIDCHPHSPKKMGNYKLYRVDVVPAARTGKTNSGIERLLMACDGEKKIFIAYTSRHDFSPEIVYKRIASLETDCVFD